MREEALRAVQRARHSVRNAWPEGRAGQVLLALLLVGVALRIVAIVSWWPVTTTLGDGYELHTSSPFKDQLHPAGYSSILAVIGVLTREVAVPVLLQHLSGIASALLLWAATRRITGSEWAALFPAGIVLLDPDFIFLEHSIMSESWFVLLISAGLYAAVRALDRPEPYWGWPLATGVALSLAVTVRTAALLMIPIVILAMVLRAPRSSGTRAVSAGAALGVLTGSVAVLLAFAVANATFGDRFGLGASPGWYLYSRAAQFADCSKFTPPDGTDVLCETKPPSERSGTRFYLFSTTSPAQIHYAPLGSHDALLRQWARRAILAQPGDYLTTVWDNLRGYWVPSLAPEPSMLTSDQWKLENGLDPQLALTNGFDEGLYQQLPAAPAAGKQRLPFNVVLRLVEDIYTESLGTFYNDFHAHQRHAGLRFLRGWQQVVRFGATALSIATILTLLGLGIGTRRTRLGVLLFGVGGLTLLIAPALTANFWARYTVPLAGPLVAASAMAIVGIIRARPWRRARGAPT
ncbi:MAG TPA: phospholipid carrier-dependent glycosyltransferase [Solirubrobacterales bacterium]